MHSFQGYNDLTTVEVRFYEETWSNIIVDVKSNSEKNTKLLKNKVSFNNFLKSLHTQERYYSKDYYRNNKQ